TQLERFNVFLPPTGRISLPGPDPSRIPTDVDGLYQVLLRIEASNDKEGDSSLANAGAGNGVIHSGAVAGFPLPVLRYFVGSSSEVPASVKGLSLLSPAADAILGPQQPLEFSWSLLREATLFRLELGSETEPLLFGAVVQQGIGTYLAPESVRPKLASGEKLRWRVLALGPDSRPLAETPWRPLRVE
ncbi:MAG: hypothetical protein KDD47_17160, partial [Acidobacteria bacterium]|nr:hypothetical protein [Acidobacteriota bacterium]